MSAAFCSVRSASARAAEVDELNIAVPSPPMAVERSARTSPGDMAWRNGCSPPPPPGGGSMLFMCEKERERES